jgi:hypothetical protein
MFMMIYVSSDTQVGRRAALRSSWMFWLQKKGLVTAPQTVVPNTWERVQNTRARPSWQAGICGYTGPAKEPVDQTATVRFRHWRHRGCAIKGEAVPPAAASCPSRLGNVLRDKPLVSPGGFVI